MESSGNKGNSSLANVSFLSNSHFESTNRIKNKNKKKELLLGKICIYEFLICASWGMCYVNYRNIQCSDIKRIPWV